MANGLTALRKIQVGKESVIGTPTAPSTQLVGRLSMHPNYAIYRPDDHDTGLFSEYYRSEIVGQQAEGTFESDFNFEQAPILLGMAVKGGVTPVGNTYDFTPDLDSAWDPDTYTFLYGDNAQVYRTPMTFARSLTISGSVDEAVMVSADLWGQKMETVSAWGAGITIPSTLEPAKTNLARVYIDGAWADIGETEVPASVLDFSWQITEGIEAIKYLNGELFPTALTESKRHVELDLTLAHNDDYTGTVLPAFLAQTKLFVQISIDGSGTKNLTLQGAFVVDNPEALADQNGQDVIKVKLISEFDATSQNEWAIGLTTV